MSSSGKHSDAKRPREECDDLIESDLELDNSDVVVPDNDPPQEMGNPTVEVADEKKDASLAEQSKALDALSEGQLSEAIDHLTEAIKLNPTSAILFATRADVYTKLKKPNAAVRDANAALEIKPDSAMGYKVRGMARAMLGQWEEAASDLHAASKSKLDYDEEIGLMLKKVEANVEKLEKHRRKYERLRKEKELKRAELEKRRCTEAQEQEALAALKEGQVLSIHSASELETKMHAAAKTSRLAVLYFTATWCGPCRFIAPIYASLAAKYPKVVFLKVDIDELSKVASRWDIGGVPTFYFLKNGKEVDNLVGADKNGLERRIDKHSQ